MSLRARLIALLLALSAAGLVTLAAVTYTTQRSFLLDTVDEQTRDAAPTLERRIDEASGIDRGPGGYGGRGRRGGFDPAIANLPPGTYGERRDEDGDVVGRPVVVAFGDDVPAEPDLPADLEPGEVRTVSSDAGDYRVRANEAFGGGMVVVAVPLGGVDATLDRLLAVEALVIAAVLALIGAASWVLVRLGLRPLEHMGETADAIAAGDLSRRVDEASPRTEVGRLGLALNAMLGRLEGAFAEREASERRLRQFLSDASHELRTPLASIRGYAELFRMGAAADPEQTTRSMGRIEEEAARMGVLVEDLLTLARLDEVRAPRREPVDLGDLAEDAVADARVVDPDRPIALEVDDDAVVQGDPDQLRQVLGNLVRNALVHTPPGTAVEVDVRRDGEQAQLEVRDHGRGLPPGDPQALFDRFWRAEGGRERGRAGAGLGLAIVAGIVAHHGGTVHAGDAPDGGASFVVRLPLSR
jgi:two-component system, OmpR family, sensor kinase